MELRKLKNICFLCANKNCRHLIHDYFWITKGNGQKPMKVGVCLDCSFELYDFNGFTR